MCARFSRLDVLLFALSRSPCFSLACVCVSIGILSHILDLSGHTMHRSFAFSLFLYPLWRFIVHTVSLSIRSVFVLCSVSARDCMSKHARARYLHRLYPFELSLLRSTKTCINSLSALDKRVVWLKDECVSWRSDVLDKMNSQRKRKKENRMVRSIGKFALHARCTIYLNFTESHFRLRRKNVSHRRRCRRHCRCSAYIIGTDSVQCEMVHHGNDM